MLSYLATLTIFENMKERGKSSIRISNGLNFVKVALEKAAKVDENLSEHGTYILFLKIIVF